jgi:hypothetical protein
MEGMEGGDWKDRASPKKRGTLNIDSLSARPIVLASKLPPLIRVSNYPQALIPSG